MINHTQDFFDKKLPPSSHFTATQLIRGKDVIRRSDLEVIPRLIFLSVWKYETRNNELRQVINDTHPKYRLVDKPGWENGIMVDEKAYDEYRKNLTIDYNKDYIE